VFAECISSAALALLETVGTVEDFRSLGFYLAGGTGLALQLDIAAMKLIALGRRGTKRDFLDLFFLLRGKMSLRELKGIVERKYTAIRYNWPHLVRSLGYFADAEEDPMPVLVVAGVKREMTQEEWREVKRFFVNLQREALLEMRQGDLR